MSDVMWIAWLALGILLLIGEMFTVGFFLFWFGLGAIAAAVVAFAGFGIAVQWATFIIVSSVGVLLSRKFALAISKPGPEAKMNVDRLIDKTGVVMDDIVPADNKGLVMVASEEWRAVTEDGSVIPQGEKIKVIRIEGTKLVVKAKIPGRWKHMTE
jgi:membrane protein implicated in regulation of membrane protease activity